MRSRFSAGALALSALLTGAPGCSIVLVQGPPRGHEQLASVPCTRSNAVPLLDAALAGTSLFVGGVLLAGTGGSTTSWVGSYTVVGAGFALEGLAFGASSLIGFHRTSRCRAAQGAVPKR